MYKYQVYLAGPISGLTYDEGKNWRDIIENLLPVHIRTLSPLRGKEFLREKGIICGASKGDNVLTTDTAIVTRDRRDIMECNAVIMNLCGADKITIGTMIEVGWIDAYRKPLILVMENTGNIHEHSMLRALAGYRVDNLKDAIKIVSLLLPE